MASFSTLDDDLLIFIASHGAPEDLLRLALTCRRLGSKFGAATRRERRMFARDAKRQRASPRGWSLMDEAARVAMEQTQTADERVCLPLRHGESWMSRFRELLLIRRPLTFDVLLGRDIAHASEDKTTVEIGEAHGDYRAALSSHAMRAGKHYASFKLIACPGIMFAQEFADVRVGVFRPTKGLDRNDKISALTTEGNGEVNYCAMDFTEGYGFPNAGNDWPGQEDFQLSDVVGMLLDLEEGTLTVYKNGRRLGVLRSGFVGEYCWGVCVADPTEESVKISRGFVPE